jgi:hypothetical protein
MSYSGDHETSDLCPYAFEKGTQGSAGRAALQRRLRPASLPDTLGECPWRDRAPDSRKSWVRFADGARRHPRLRPARGGCPARGLLAPQANPQRFRRRANGSSRRALAPLSQGVRQGQHLVDLGDGSTGEFRGRDNPEEGERGDHPRYLGAPRQGLAAGQAMDRERWIESPDPEYARKKGIEIG